MPGMREHPFTDVDAAQDPAAWIDTLDAQLDIEARHTVRAVRGEEIPVIAIISPPGCIGPGWPKRCLVPSRWMPTSFTGDSFVTVLSPTGLKHISPHTSRK